MHMEDELYTNAACRTKIEPKKRSPKNSLQLEKSKARIQKCETNLNNFDVNPKELNFKRFELNKAYKKSIQVTNTGRNTTRFEVLQLPVGSEFNFELVSAKSSLAPGMTVAVQVSFNPTKLNDKSETLHIKVDKGKTLHVALKAMRDPPNLTFTGQDLKFCSQEETIDIGYFFVGSHNKMDLCLIHQGGAARYFVLPSARYNELNTELGVPLSSKLYLDRFTIEPVYFSMKHKTKLIFSLEFSPEYCGVYSNRVIFLCDNGATNNVTFKGHGVEFVKSHIGFEDVESKNNFPVNSDALDDLTCEWYYDMGPVNNQVAVRTFTLRNICPAKNKFSFEWRLEAIRCNNRASIPAENVSIIPSQGEFTHNTSVTFKVSCNVPSEVDKDVGFIGRLFCYLPKGSVCYREFKSSLITTVSTRKIDDGKEELENDGFDIRSQDPSFIIPSNTGTECVCVGSIEFVLDCRPDIAFSFNPCYINFQAPLAINQKTRYFVFVKNECSLTLTCQCSRKSDNRRIVMNMVPEGFTLGPFEEKRIDIRIKPISLEPFQLEIVCRIKENHQYRPTLKITGNVSAGEIEVVEHIVNYGTVKQGDLIQVPIEFKSYIHTNTEWNMYIIKESLHELDPCLDRFLTRVKNTDCMQYNVNDISVDGIETIKECDTENKKKKVGNQICNSSCLTHRKNIPVLINDFRKMFTEMCKINYEKNNIVLKHQTKNGTRRYVKNPDVVKKSSKNLNLTDSYRFLKFNILSQLVAETIDRNMNSINDNENMEPILTGYLSNSDLKHRRGMFCFASESSGLEYKLLELRVQDCVRHKLVIAEFCPPVVALQPTVVDIGHTSPNVKSELCVSLINHTRCSWKYSWGQPEDIDEGMLNLTIEKKHGTLDPERTEDIRISFQPSNSFQLEEVCVPCFIEGFIEPLQLIIRGKVENLNVTISWETYDKTRMTFHLPDDDLVTEKIIWCGLDVFIMCPKSMQTLSRSISYDRVRSVSENFTVSKSYSVVSNLDFNFKKDLDKEAQTISSEKDLSDAEDESFLRMSTITKKSDALLYGQYEGIFCSFLHFENVNIKMPTKQTITVTNPTTNRCKFKISVQYFKPIIEEKQGKQYIIPTKRKHDINWEDLIDLNKGLVISGDTDEYEIANQDLDVEIWVYASTWGLYMDNVTLEFASLPLFHIPVSVSVRNTPVQFSPTKCFQNMETPIYEMTPISFGSLQNFISIPIENNSGVPLKVIWTTCNQGEEQNEEWSNIALDLIFTKDQNKIPPFPEQSKSQAFHIDDNGRLMKLNANDSIHMLTIRFNADLLSHEMEASLFKTYVSGYVMVDGGLVKNVGVYREVKQVSCQVLAIAGAARLQFTPHEPKERFFWFQTRRIFSSPYKIQKEKTFELQNLHNLFAICEIRTQEPFSITQVVIDDISVNFDKSILIPPKKTIQITVRCTVTPNTVKRLETGNSNTFSDESIVFRRLLQVFYNMNRMITSLELGIQITTPVIKVSTDMIRFPTIYVGDTAFKFFNVEIINGNKEDINIVPQQCEQSPFSFQVEPNASETTLHIRIKFTPRESNFFKEDWMLTAFHCCRTLKVSGCGDEDQKHRV